MALNEREAIQKPRLLIKCGVVLLAVFAGFVPHSVIHIEPSIVALLGAGILVLISGTGPEQYLAGVEWETLLFFAGLFIMVGALVKTGVIGTLARLAADATGGNALLAVMLILGVSAVLSGVIDNIPYVATMSPLVLALTNDIPDPAHSEALWWSLAHRRRLRRQHDRGRRQRQRGDARHRRPLGLADLVLGVHQEGLGRHGDHGAGGRALPVAALFRLGVTALVVVTVEFPYSVKGRRLETWPVPRPHQCW